MARARDILVRFLGDDKDFTKSAKKVESGIGGLRSKFDAAKTAIQGFIALQVIRVMKDWAEAAAEDAKSIDTLNVAIRQNTGATDAQIAANEKWIDSMQLATLVADTELRQAMQSLVVSGASVEEAQRIIATSADIAAARGKEFMTVIEAMVKAQNGQTTGLGRLGIATKNVAGETLSFDQILQNAATTMGGQAAEGANTMAGAMERAAILIAEAKEEAGTSVDNPWTEFMDGLLLVGSHLGFGKRETAALNLAFNNLIRQGINPTTNKTRSLVEVLKDMLRESDVGADSIQTLRMILAMTDNDVRSAADQIEQYGLQWGFSREQVQALVDLLRKESPDEIHDSWMNLGKAMGRELAGEIPKSLPAIRNLTTELSLAAEAGQNVADSILAATDPIFAGVDAWKRYRDALKEARKDGKLTKEEQLELLEAQLRFNAAMGELSPAEYEKFMEAVQLSTGKSREEVELLLASLGLIDGKTFTATVRANVTMADVVGAARAPGRGRGTEFNFQSGGVVPGPTGAPHTATVHGGETIVPAHKAGLTKGTSSLPLGNNEVITSDGRRMTATAAAYHESRLKRSAKRARINAGGTPIYIMFDQYSNHIEAYRNAQEIARIQDARARQKAR